MTVKFSLVMATIERTEELERFLRHLSLQTHLSFELIVVDQNQDLRLTPILAPYLKRMEIKVIRQSPGTCRARNTGLLHATGDVVSFPDDDCWYSPDVLEKAARYLRDHPEIQGVLGRSVDEDGRKTTLRGYRFARKVNKVNVNRTALSFAMFLRKETLSGTCFDESIARGSGSLCYAGEETDLLLQLMTGGMRFQYEPSITVFHKEPASEMNEKTWSRAYHYGVSAGYVNRKHHMGKTVFFLHFILKGWLGLTGAWLCRHPGKVRYYRLLVRGRMEGWKLGGMLHE